MTPSLKSNQFQAQNYRAVEPPTKLASIPGEMESYSVREASFKYLLQESAQTKPHLAEACSELRESP